MKMNTMIATTLILLISLSPAASLGIGTADALQEDGGLPFYIEIRDHVLTSVEVVTKAVSKRIDNLPLPAGAASVLEAVVVDEALEPRTAPVSGFVRYGSNGDIEELRRLGGAEVAVDDGVTVTVSRLLIESEGNAISFSTAGQGRIVVGSVSMEGVVMPFPMLTVRADDASISSSYHRDGEERSFLLDVSYSRDLAITIGEYTVTYSSEDRSDIRISVGVDLTDYKGYANAPGLHSTVDRLLRYIGSLDLVRLDVDIDIEGSYGIAGYPNPFRIEDMSLSIDSHKEQEAPYYSIDLSIGNVRAYPVDNSGMRISMELPATRMKDGSLPTMDRSKAFRLTADSISVDRVEPDEPLDVHVDDLAIVITSDPEPSLSLSMKRMANKGAQSYDEGAFHAETTVSGFETRFKGTTTELLDDAKGLIRMLLLPGKAVEGTLALEKTEYVRYDADGQPYQKAVVRGLDMVVTLAIPLFRIHLELDSFEYFDPYRDLSSSPIGFDLRMGVDLEFDIMGASSLKDLLGILSAESVAEIDAEGDHDYRFALDEGRAFLIGLASEGLEVRCGDDSIAFDRASVSGLSLYRDIELRYLRMTAQEAAQKVPDGLRHKLNGGAIIELSNSYLVQKLDGKAEVNLKTDIDPIGAGAYLVDAYRNSLDKVDASAKDGSVSFKTDEMGVYAVSGPLKDPDRTAGATALLVLAIAMGIITALIGRRYLGS
ncbi:MAG: hypothetical protein IKQ57_03665 [Candidatus Methanomethylophilaceae archaeon]|nr:hypothetical protein [Candidatus Methanomethylophilaceae archaeon]